MYKNRILYGKGILYKTGRHCRVFLSINSLNLRIVAYKWPITPNTYNSNPNNSNYHKFRMLNVIILSGAGGISQFFFIEAAILQCIINTMFWQLKTFIFRVVIVVEHSYLYNKSNVYKEGALSFFNWLPLNFRIERI